MTDEALQAAIDDATTRAKMKKVIPLTHVADCTLVAEAQKRTWHALGPLLDFPAISFPAPPPSAVFCAPIR